MLHQLGCSRLLGRLGVFGGMVVLAGFLGIRVAAGADIFVNTASYSLLGVYGASGTGNAVDVTQSDFKQTFGTTSSPVSVGEDFVRSLAGPEASVSYNVFMSARANYKSLSVGHGGLISAATTSATDNRTAFGHIIRSEVTARWQDTITIIGQQPQPGRKIKVSGMLELSGDVSISAGSQFSNTGVPNAVAAGEMYAELYAPNGSLPTGEYGPNVWALGSDNTNIDPALFGGNPAPDVIKKPPKLISINMTLFEGEPFTLDYMLRITVPGMAASIGAARPSSANIAWDLNFKNTLNWGGITGVTDFVTGAPIGNWSMTSASGADYTVGVPEPACVALLAFAGPMLLLRRRV